MTDQKKVKYHGWENVPINVLVRAKNKWNDGVSEYYIKLDGLENLVCITGDYRFSLAQYDPDGYTTGVYKAVHLK